MIRVHWTRHVKRVRKRELERERGGPSDTGNSPYATPILRSRAAIPGEGLWKHYNSVFFFFFGGKSDEVRRRKKKMEERKKTKTLDPSSTSILLRRDISSSPMRSRSRSRPSNPRIGRGGSDSKTLPQSCPPPSVVMFICFAGW